MAITDATTKNSLADSYATLCTHAAFHTGSPATAANELTGAGSARGVIAWGSATAGAKTWSATITAPTAGGNAFCVGFWSALTAGTFRDGQYDITDIVFSTPGNASVSGTYTQS
jgi:hypothetical protein